MKNLTYLNGKLLQQTEVTNKLEQYSRKTALPQYCVNNLIKYLSSDDSKKLAYFLDKQSIRINIRMQQNWTLLHLCGKYDAYHCAVYISRAAYQEDESIYIEMMKQCTKQGYTPFMTAIIYGADRVFNLFLLCGGFDLQQFDSCNRQPYDLAIHYQNEWALQKIVNCKQYVKLNEQYLKQQIEIGSEQAQNNKYNVMDCLLQYFCCIKIIQPSSYETKFSSSVLASKNKSVWTQTVKTKNIQPPMKIKPQIISKVIKCKIPLYGNYSPHDISEGCQPCSTMLVVMQSLCDYPWLIRQIIQVKDKQNNQFEVKLFHQRAKEIIRVNSQLQVDMNSNKIKYLFSHKEQWPMLIQKGLAQLFGGYRILQTFNVFDIFKTLSCFPVRQIPITVDNKLTIDIRKGLSVNTITYLQQFSLQGYLVVLKGRQSQQQQQQLYGSRLHDLNNPKKVQHFTILNFVNYLGMRYLLVNCSFTNQEWIEKQKSQPLHFKMLKSHFSNPKQMCVSIPESALHQHFSSVVVSAIKPGYVRSDCNFVVQTGIQSQSFYFKIHVKYKSQGSIFLRLIDYDSQEGYQINNLQYIRQDDYQIQCNIQRDIAFPQMVSLELFGGDYLCRLDVPPSKSIKIGKKLSLVCWGTYECQVQFVQNKLAILEWVQCYKMSLISNWNRGNINIAATHPATTNYIITSIQSKLIVITRNHSAQQARMHINNKVVLQNISIIDAQNTHQKQLIGLIRQGNYFYALLQFQNISQDTFKTSFTLEFL